MDESNNTLCTKPASAQQNPPSIDHRPFGPRFLTPMYIGAALNPINSSVIATALVSIATAMGVSIGQTAILISILYLTSAIAQPTAGRLAEEFGPRRVFLIGIGIVIAGGILGGVAQNLATLVVSRALIGIGTSAGYPSVMLLIRQRADSRGLPSTPTSVLGGLAVSGAATLAIGPTVGGLLVGWFNWRAAFFVNIPFACAALIMALIWITKDPDRPDRRSVRETAARIDPLGVIGFSCATISLIIFLLSLPHPKWILLGLSITITVVLTLWELKATNPFINVRILVSNLPLTRTYLRNGLTLLGIYVILYGLTQWIQITHEFSAFHAGLILVPMGLLSAVSARFASRCKSIRSPLIFSATLMIFGAVATHSINRQTPIFISILVMAIFGIISGLTNVTNQAALYKQAPASTIGTASGLLRTFGYIGSIGAATVTGFAFRHDADDAGLHQISLILIGVGVAVLLMTVLDRHLSSTSQAEALQP
ncbi:MFS transporter [Rhodococcus globerulus]|uniref:MFS transporter n=1 Tax=Rhodococcus globerulus TaxID=33008 RepID=A0ABU4C5E8_RHOGO|nr:MFS transporter [Rhodococcus globerulus]MDV6271481.1 MFS transporter [Rhodococcus globerulus]